ncbi:MAG: Cof-type HAD-IIB family hydrolase [Clostridiales bacterium]|nr:Cof-type HAD-IIB family hydrolase [Clostridiales bacterium]
MSETYKALLASDMDLTLLSPGKDVPEGNKEAIRALKDARVAFTIATGRSSFLVGKFAEDLGIDVPLITSNGGSLFDAKTRTQFASRDFDDTKIRTMLRFLLDNDADATLYSDEGIFFAPCSSRKFFVEGYNVGVEPSKQAPIIDIGKDFPDQGSIPRFNKILLIRPNKEVKDYVTSDPELEAISSGMDLFDVMPKGSSKGDALLSLADYLNIPESNTFAIGDNENDISMIAAARYGIAMGNATEGAKKAAYYITADYDSLGFAKAVYDFIIPLVSQF